MRPDDAAFFKKVTGIHDDEALKQHILDVQAKAYKVTTHRTVCDETHWFTFRLHLTGASIFSLSSGICYVQVEADLIHEHRT
jgi:hypothetical protein